MANLLKDLAVLLFSAGEEIEKKADEFRKNREERYQQFEDKLKEGKEKFNTAFDDEIRKAKENLSGLTDRLGLASKREIDEMKRKLDDLAEKIDRMGKNS